MENDKVNNPIYLVFEFDNDLIYLPFKNLSCVDDYTMGFDNLLELSATTMDILSLNIPKEEILDVYLSEDISKINDDMQEFNKRYLSVKYSRDNYDKLDLEKNFINYLKNNIDKNIFSEFNGLKSVYDNYIKKYALNREITDKDIMRIALLYLSDNYKRYKECYYILKDKNYKTKIKKHKLINLNKKDELLEEDNISLINNTDMSIEELTEFINKQNKGKKR